jgi:hypothetical protein
MYGIFACIWAILGVNVGKYYIYGASGTKDVPSVRTVIDTTFQLIDSPKLSHQRQQSTVSYQNV